MFCRLMTRYQRLGFESAQARFERFKRIFNDPAFLVSTPSFSGIGYFVTHEHPITFVAELLVYFLLSTV